MKSVAEWRPIPGSLEAIAALSTAGFRVVVVTNQSGVARGLFDERTLAAIHERMRAAARSAGGDIAGIYYCPHHPDGRLRLPQTAAGLLRQVERDFHCSLRGAPFIGDKTSDLDAADAVGARPILVRTGAGAATERERSGGACETFDDLRAAAAALLAEGC